MKTKDPAGTYTSRNKGFRYRLIAEGAVIGVVTGALISMFRLMLTGADKLRDIMVIYAGGGAVDRKSTRLNSSHAR